MKQGSLTKEEGSVQLTSSCFVKEKKHFSALKTADLN
jgi:hypothetical protein